MNNGICRVNTCEQWCMQGEHYWCTQSEHRVNAGVRRVNSSVRRVNSGVHRVNRVYTG